MDNSKGDTEEYNVPCEGESGKCRECRKAADDLHSGILLYCSGTVPGKEEADSAETLDRLLWQAVIAYQNVPFHTSSGLPFSYTVRRRKDGEYSGELVVSRKEGSKTLTKSSVLLAFHKVLYEIGTVYRGGEAGEPVLVLPEYKGPKTIGQIFGISYLYSLFWKLGLIRVPERVEEKLKGNMEQ